MIVVVGPIDNCAAQALLAIIKDYGLAWRNCSCRIVKLNRYHLIIITDRYRYALIDLTVAELSGAVEMATIAADYIVNPVNVTGFQVRSVQMLIFITLTDV